MNNSKRHRKRTIKRLKNLSRKLFKLKEVKDLIKTPIEVKEEVKEPIKEVTELKELPLELFYSSPVGGYDNKLLTQKTHASSTLYDKVGSNIIGSVNLMVGVCPTNNENTNLLSVIATFYIYDKTHNYGFLYCEAIHIVHLNFHGIFSDGIYEFKIIIADGAYNYLMPCDDEYKTLTLTVKDGVRHISIPKSEKNVKVCYTTHIDFNKVKSKFKLLTTFKDYKGNYESSTNGLNYYSLTNYTYDIKNDNNDNNKDFTTNKNINEKTIEEIHNDQITDISVYFSNKTSNIPLKNHLNSNKTNHTGIMYWNIYSNKSKIIDLSFDSTIYLSISNEFGNITVMFFINEPIANDGLWTQLNKIHIGYVIDATFKYKYLNYRTKYDFVIIKYNLEKNNYEIYIPSIEYEPPIKYTLIPNIISNKITTYNQFNVSIPSNIGPMNDINSNLIKNTIGAIVSSNPYLEFKDFNTFSTYSSIYDINTVDNIGIQLGLSHVTKVDDIFCQVHLKVYYFYNNTFLAVITSGNGELISGGGAPNNVFIRVKILCHSSNYKRPIYIADDTKIFNKYNYKYMQVLYYEKGESMT
jgi:hypothetical protein